MADTKVSAIMPTRGRCEMARRAKHAFLAQTYTAKELVIIDDPDEPSFDWDGWPREVVYRRARGTIGAKRNLACAGATGEIILHWDSDDLYHPERIEHQVKMLRDNHPADIVGYNEMDFQTVGGGPRYRYHGSLPIGVSFCYWRRVWEARGFKDVDLQEEYSFVGGRRFVCCAAEGRIVATIHEGNTSKREPGKNPAQWRQVA